MRRWIPDLTRTTTAPEPAANGPDPGPPAPPASDWPQRLQAASGDDAALLALVADGAPLEVKLAAVEALQDEASLRQAEVAFRSHDRRVHRLAKQRLGAKQAAREAREGADRVLATARTAAAQPHIAANELVELDRAWRALDVALVDAAVREEFSALMDRMAEVTRERADQPQRLRRWTEQAQATLARLEAAGVQAIEGAGTEATEGAEGDGARDVLAEAAAAVRDALAAAPTDAATTHCELLRRGLDLAEALVPRVAVLAEWPQLPLPAWADRLEAAESADETPVARSDPRADDAQRALVERWVAFEPLGRPSWDEPLQRRFAAGQEARAKAIAAHRSRLRELRRREGTQALGAALDQAEAALDGGQLAQTRTLLAEIDRLAAAGTPPAALRGRIDALQARFAQLKGWQQWAGSRARDELLQQAEALAAAVMPPPPSPAAPEPTAPADVDTLSEGQPEGKPEGKPGGKSGEKSEGKRVKSGPSKPGVKLSTKQLVEVITDLRARWKELDHAGGGTNHALWKRFDAALETAYQPVAAQLEAQRQAREQNLQERERLLVALEALALPADDGSAAPAEWRSLAGRLDHFHVAWRKLGPVEHTVPQKARKAVAARMSAAVQRVEAPLQAVRQAARAEREQLVAEARALAADAGGRDLVPRSRELQARWQQHAQAVPLARADEGALWQQFKSAIDGAFAARHAAFDARHTQFKAVSAERQALIARLEALNAETPPAQIRRELAEVEAQWFRLPPPAREDAGALESRVRRAHEAAERLLGQSAQRQWHGVCDALQAKLALCVALEDPAAVPPPAADTTAADATVADATVAETTTAENTAGDTAAATTTTSDAPPPSPASTTADRWSAWPALPEPLERALAERAGLAPPAPAASRLATATDELLLQLEAAWGLASPAAFEDARRTLKLQAMKAALESRRPVAPPPPPAQMLAELLRRARLDAAQRARLDGIVAGLRQRGSLAAR